MLIYVPEITEFSIELHGGPRSHCALSPKCNFALNIFTWGMAMLVISPFEVDQWFIIFGVTDCSFGLLMTRNVKSGREAWLALSLQVYHLGTLLSETWMF